MSPPCPRRCRRRTAATRSIDVDAAACSASTAGPSRPGRSPRPPASPRARSSGSSSPRTSWSTRPSTRAFEPEPCLVDRIAEIDPRPAAARPAGRRWSRSCSSGSAATFDADEEGGHGAARPTTCTTATRTGRVSGRGSTSCSAELRRRRRRPARASRSTQFVHVAAAAHLRRQPPAHRRRPAAHPRADRRHRPARPAHERERLMLLRLLRTHLAPYKPWLAAIVVLQFIGDGRDALPAQPQRRHHRQGRRHRRHRTTSCTPARSCSAVSLRPDRLLGRRGPVRARGPRCAFGRDLRAALFHRVGSFSAREVQQFGAPSLITRNTNDVQQVQMLVLMACTLAVSAPIMMVGGIVMAMREDLGLSWLLARRGAGAVPLRRASSSAGWCRASG